MPDVALRPATAQDEAFLLALYASTREHDLGALPIEQRDGLLRLQYRAQRAHYARCHPGARDEVVTLAGEPVGRLRVDDGGDDGVRIVDISLLPAFRGRGIGSELIRDVQARAAAAGRIVRLSVMRGSPATALYRRLGFEESGGDAVHAFLWWRAP